MYFLDFFVFLKTWPTTNVMQDANTKNLAFSGKKYSGMQSYGNVHGK